MRALKIFMSAAPSYPWLGLIPLLTWSWLTDGRTYLSPVCGVAFVYILVSLFSACSDHFLAWCCRVTRAGGFSPDPPTAWSRAPHVQEHASPVPSHAGYDLQSEVPLLDTDGAAHLYSACDWLAYILYVSHFGNNRLQIIGKTFMSLDEHDMTTVTPWILSKVTKLSFKLQVCTLPHF
jgi:hypothetical protein